MNTRSLSRAVFTPSTAAADGASRIARIAIPVLEFSRLR